MTDVLPVTALTRLTARALIVGERIDTAGLERPDMISSLPLAFRVGSLAGKPAVDFLAPGSRPLLLAERQRLDAGRLCREPGSARVPASLDDVGAIEVSVRM